MAHRRPAPASSLASATALAVVLAVAATDCDRSDPPPGSDQTPSGETTSEGTPPDEPGSDETGSLPSLPGDKPPGSLDPSSRGPPTEAVFLTAGLKGYLEPCGCSADVLLGGAERIAGYVERARTLHPATTVLDAGDTFFEQQKLAEHRVAQAEAKRDVVASLLDAMGTRATVPGERDLALGSGPYLETVRDAGIEPLGANLKLQDHTLEPSTTLELGDWRLGVVGVVEPALFENVDDATALETDDRVASAVEGLRGDGADAVLALVHGRLKFVRGLLSTHRGLDFAVVGHGPRETDQVHRAGDGYTLEAYDQGRYVGVLKLYGPDRDRPFERAYAGSDTQLEKVERQIRHVDESLSELERRTDDSEGDPPALLERLRARLDRLKRQRRDLENAEIEVSETRRSFLYRPVPIEPGYPVDRSIKRRRAEYNRRLEDLNRRVTRSAPEPPDDGPTYLGTRQCQTCHPSEHGFWKKTEHGDALETLQEREKAHDQRCIGCHVVGYEKPGGSVLGKLQYERTIDGRSVQKDLRNVGCESCHGPGSTHRQTPGADPASLEGFVADPGVEQCKQCHVPEHSPTFDFESYVERITGEGHPRSSP